MDRTIHVAKTKALISYAFRLGKNSHNAAHIMYMIVVLVFTVLRERLNNLKKEKNNFYKFFTLF